MNLFEKILQLPRLSKRVISLVIDMLCITTAFFGAFWTRLDVVNPFSLNPSYQLIYAITLITTMFVFIRFGLYRAILRFMSVKTVMTILVSCIFSTGFLVFVSYYTHTFVPRSIPIIYLSYLLLLCGGMRFFAINFYKHILANEKENVIIYGAGAAGRELAYLLQKGDVYKPVCFIDDDGSLTKHSIQGLNVFSHHTIDNTIKKFSATKILLAIPSVSRARRKEIISSLIDFNVEVLTIPPLKEVLNGSIQLDSLKDVDISDLLGRDPVNPNKALMSKNIEDKNVMVTGAGGSIGSELCRQIVQLKPKNIILFESSEFNLYQIDAQLNQFKRENNLEVNIFPLLGSVQSIEKLSKVMQEFEIETVFHAAAFKHVPLVEYNVIEGIKNNVFGTYYAAKAALNSGVKSFVLISTDKAVRPTNIMGTTKRLAELSLQALAHEESLKSNPVTCFSMVRFGNVLGSSGSVIPLFKKQINAGGPVTVTHPDITRYFMTIPEAAQLVIQAGAMARGGDLFVLDMGEPVKINELAINLIKLSGLDVKSESNPYGDISIEYSGLRPGEKLYEELLIGEDVSGTEHERIMMAREQFLTLEAYTDLLDSLELACSENDQVKIREILLNTPTGFAPNDEINDLSWHQKHRITTRNVVDITGKVNAT